MLEENLVIATNLVGAVTCADFDKKTPRDLYAHYAALKRLHRHLEIMVSDVGAELHSYDEAIMTAFEEGATPNVKIDGVTIYLRRDRAMKVTDPEALLDWARRNSAVDMIEVKTIYKAEALIKFIDEERNRGSEVEVTDIPGCSYSERYSVAVRGLPAVKGVSNG